MVTLTQWRRGTREGGGQWADRSAAVSPTISSSSSLSPSKRVRCGCLLSIPTQSTTVVTRSASTLSPYTCSAHHMHAYIHVHACTCIPYSWNLLQIGKNIVLWRKNIRILLHVIGKLACALLCVLAEKLAFGNTAKFTKVFHLQNFPDIQCTVYDPIHTCTCIYRLCIPSPGMVDLVRLAEESSSLVCHSVSRQLLSRRLPKSASSLTLFVSTHFPPSPVSPVTSISPSPPSTPPSSHSSSGRLTPGLCSIASFPETVLLTGMLHWPYAWTKGVKEGHVTCHVT